MFKLTGLIAALRKAVALNVQDEATLIVYLAGSDTLDAVRESQTRDAGWSETSGAWQRLGYLGFENLAEIAALDDAALANYVRMRAFLPGVDRVIE